MKKPQGAQQSAREARRLKKLQPRLLLYPLISMLPRAFRGVQYCVGK